jgi:putative PIN family toxin of toxin-antitoxin system
LEDIIVRHELVLSEFILGEFERKLDTKFMFPASDRREAERFLRHIASIVVPQPIAEDACRDIHDLPILGTAVAARASFLVTVDRDLLAIGSFRDFVIIKPGQYWHRASL